LRSKTKGKGNGQPSITLGKVLVTAAKLVAMIGTFHFFKLGARA